MSQKEKPKKPLSQIENLSVFHQGGQSQDHSIKGGQSQSQDRTSSDDSQASRVASQAQASQGVAFQYERQELPSTDSSLPSSQEISSQEMRIKIQEANYRLIDNGLIQWSSDDENTNQTVSEVQSQPGRLFVYSSRYDNSQNAKSYSQ